MAGDVKELFEEVRKTHKELTAHMAKKDEENESVRAETQLTIDKINTDLTALMKRYDEAIASAQRPVITGAGDQERTEEEKLHMRAFEKLLRYGNGEQGRTMMDKDEIRALTSGSDKDGGFLVPTSWENDLITQAYNEGELRPIIGAKPTSRDSVFMPALAKPLVSWGTAGLIVSPQELEAGGERITINDLKALVLIHNNTLEDADADIWGELSQMFSQAIGEAEDDAFAIGAGADKPLGVFTDERVQANFTATGVAGAIIDSTHNGIDVLIQAMYKLKKAYRRNATWAMNSTVESIYRQVKDADANYGKYIWQPPVQAGDPATLLGKPVVNPEGAPDVSAGTIPVVIGDFKRGYRIRDRKGVTITRLTERYAEYDQTGFLIKRRTGGQVVLGEAFQCIKVQA